MAGSVKRTVVALLVVVILVVIGISYVDGARGGGGGRGGGARGGSRSGSRSSRSSSRTGSSSSSRFTKVRTRYGGPSYKPSYWGTGMAVGYLYGVSSYKHRRRYRDNPSNEPTICFNENSLKNGTFGYFICPLPNQDDDLAYCCGNEDAEHCCKYFDDPGRIAGLVIGIVAFCALVGVGIYCYCTRCRGKGKSRGVTIQKNSRNKSVGLYSGAEGVPLKDQFLYDKAHTPPGTQPNDIPLTNTYGVQPHDGGAMPPPQGYGVPTTGYDSGAGGLPYNPNPDPAGYPPNQGVPMGPGIAPPVGPGVDAPMGPGMGGPYPPQPLINYGLAEDGTKQPLPPSDVNPNDPYRAAPGIGFTYSDPSAPSQGYAPGAGQPYPPAPPPPYPGGN